MSDRARIERLRDWFALQLDFAETLAAKSDIPLDEAVTFYTNLHRRFGFGRPAQGKRSAAWDAFARDLVGLTTRDERLACVMELARERFVSWSDPARGRFGCFAFDPPQQGAVRIHFSPNDTEGGVGPLSRAKVAKRVNELREMFAFLRAEHPESRVVVGGSWLYHIEAYRRLFPPAYIASLALHTSPSALTGGSWWGQFLDHDQNVLAERVDAFSKNLLHLEPAAAWKVFPMPAMTARAGIDVFHEHYERGAAEHSDRTG
jgi:hypothetical protein